MSVSRTQIYNMALGFVGTRAIASPNERTPEAMACELYWDRARRSSLRDFPWPFSQRRIRLAETGLPEEMAGVWKHACGLPAEVVKVGRLASGGNFELGQSDGALRLFCDEAGPVAVCTVDVPDPGLWDELFIMAMAYRLAMLIAVPLLKGNPQKLQELASLYQNALPKAEGHGANEGKEARPEMRDSWIEAREMWP